jgi:hypothetical protein
MQIALRRLEDELASYDKATRVAELPGGDQMVRLAADQGYANDQNNLAMMQRRSGRAAELRRGDKWSRRLAGRRTSTFLRIEKTTRASKRPLSLTMMLRSNMSRPG